MQNINTISYINKTKIINIKSEILYREAEDDFFYFNKINKAQKKLIEAVKLTPWHLKSLILLADIYFIKGFTKKAFVLYKRAEEIEPDSARILAAIANCLYTLSNTGCEILIYCEKAINCLNEKNNYLLASIIEMKINILIAQKNYKEAYAAFVQAQNKLDKTFMIYNINYKILNDKINLQKRIKNSKLQIV